MAGVYDCEYCTRSYKVRKNRGRHYLIHHNDKDLAIEQANEDGYFEISQPTRPMRPSSVSSPKDSGRNARPSTSKSSSAVNTYDKAGKKCGDKNWEDENPIDLRVRNVISKDDRRQDKVINCSRGNPIDADDDVGTPSDSQSAHPSSSSNKRKRSDDEHRVVIIKNIRGSLNTEDFRQRFIPYGAYSRVQAFPVLSSSIIPKKREYTTGQIEFYTQQDAMEYKDSIVKIAKTSQIIVELTKDFIPNPEDVLQSEMNQPNKVASNERHFILIQGAPPKTNSFDVLGFLQKAKVIPEETHILEEVGGRCNGTVICTFGHPDEAITATSQDQKLLLGARVSVSLISRKDKGRMTERWEQRNDQGQSRRMESNNDDVTTKRFVSPSTPPPSQVNSRRMIMTMTNDNQPDREQERDNEVAALSNFANQNEVRREWEMKSGYQQLRNIPLFSSPPIPSPPTQRSNNPFPVSHPLGEQQGGIVLLRNIPYEATMAQIHQHIQSILGIMIDIRKIEMKFGKEGQCNGTAHLHMDTKEKAYWAEKKLANTLLINRYIGAFVRKKL